VLLACVGVEADEALTRLAAALPPRHRAVFVPFVPRPLAFYHLAAAAALPSRIEGCPSLCSRRWRSAAGRGLECRWESISSPTA
jgi:hypothetical protein